MTSLHVDYIIEGFPTLVEGYFFYETPGRKEKTRFYFRGLSDGRWTLDVGDESFHTVGVWNNSRGHLAALETSQGFGMDADTAEAIILDCAHEWGLEAENGQLAINHPLIVMKEIF